MPNDLLQEDFIEELTNASLTASVRKRIMRVTAQMSQEQKERVAHLIDHTCTYVRYSESVGLFEGTLCGMEDWHTLAKLIRGPDNA